MESSSGVILATYGAAATRSRPRTRVASKDWWASRKVESVTRIRCCSRIHFAKPSGPSSARSCLVPAGAGVEILIFGSFSAGSIFPSRVPHGLLTVTSASHCSTLVPRSCETLPCISSGRSSMKCVDSSPEAKVSSAKTACRKLMFVATPRMRNSARARFALSTAEWKSRPRVINFTSIESK